MGEIFTHLHVHTQYSTLDGVSTPEEYMGRCKELGMTAIAITDHGSMASFPDAYFAAKENNIRFIPGCFKPTQKIFTEDGIKEICSIRPGDKVLTKSNKFRTVKNVQIRTHNGDMVRIKAWCVEDQISTPEHPFLVRKVERWEEKRGVWKENITIDWVQAQDLERVKYWRTYKSKKSKDRSNKRRYKYYLCVPRFNRKGIDTINLGNVFNDNATINVINEQIKSVIYKRAGFRTTTQVGLPLKLKLDHELLWIMGLWLAEGSCKNGLIFSLASDELNFYYRISNYFNKYGINTRYRLRNGCNESRPREAMDVIVYSTFVGRLFTNLFGSGFDQKRIPNWMLFGLSGSQAHQLLEGLLDGDGKRTKYNSTLKLNNETLIWQARVLMAHLSEPQYSAVSVSKCNKSDNKSFAVVKRESGHFYYDYDDEYIYLPVCQVQREKYAGLVYNLEVDKDQSYNTGVVVHNCEFYYNDYHLDLMKFNENRDSGEGQTWQALKQLDPERHERMRKNRHVTILAKNQVGYKNLISMAADSWENGFYYKPRIWFDKLAQYREGLILLTGCFNGPMCYEVRNAVTAIKAGDESRARRYLGLAKDWLFKVKELFGDDLYIEMQMPGTDLEGSLESFEFCANMSDKHGIKSVITNDSHYIKREDFLVQKCMMAVDQNLTMTDPGLFIINSDEQFFKTRDELRQMFTAHYNRKITLSKFEECCDNTMLVAEKCEGFKPDLSPKLPLIEDADNKLAKLVLISLREKGLYNNPKKYLVDGEMVTHLEQTKIELGRIVTKGFASYFLITMDLVQFSKKSGWDNGPGRGSCSGSLICYLLGITEINPLWAKLSFNRFMSPSRGGYLLKVSMD